MSNVQEKLKLFHSFDDIRNARGQVVYTANIDGDSWMLYANGKRLVGCYPSLLMCSEGIEDDLNQQLLEMKELETFEVDNPDHPYEPNPYSQLNIVRLDKAITDMGDYLTYRSEGTIGRSREGAFKTDNLPEPYSARIIPSRNMRAYLPTIEFKGHLCKSLGMQKSLYEALKLILNHQVKEGEFE